MRKLIYLFYAVVVLAALAIAALAAMALLIDPNKFKPEIEELVQRTTERTLKLEGQLGLAFYPSLGVSLGKATLSERGGAKQFAAMDSAHVSVAVWPLLRGEMVADEVRLSGLRASIVRFKDGSTNVDDLLAPPAAKPEREREAGKGAKPVRLDISGIRVEGATLAYRDEGAGRSLSIEGLELRTGRIAPDVPGALKVSTRLKGSNPEIDLKIDLSGEYRFNLEKQVFSLSKLEAKAAGRAAAVSSLDLGAKGDLAAKLGGPEYRIANFSLEAKGVLGKEAFSARVSAPQLALGPGKPEPGALEAEISLKGGARDLQGKLSASGVQGSMEALAVSALKGNVSLAMPELPQKSLALELSGEARADLAKDSAAANLALKFDETNARLKLELAKLASTPEVVFDASVDKLNVDRYLPPAEEKPKDQPGASAGAAPEQPLDLSALKALNARGKAQIGALIVQRMKLSEVRAELRLANGRLELSPHTAKLYEGSLEGALSADANGNRIALKESLSGVAIGPLVRDLAGRDALEGRGNIALDVRGAGATAAAIRKSLDGSARVALRDGAIKGINLAETLRKAKGKLGSQTAEKQGADAGEKTDFSELTASFVIRDGVARNDDLAAKSPFFRLSGAGEIDLGRSKLDYLAKAAVVASTKGQGGAELERLAGVTVPVKLSGPFEAVSYEIDYGAMAASLAKSKVADKLGERLGVQGDAGAAPKDKVKEKLRGLFGR